MAESVSRHSRRQRRSLSPRDRAVRKDYGKRRERSPHQDSRSQTSTTRLPYEQRSITRHDLEQHQALFAEYLDVQKGLNFSSLPESEIKGRWKSFIGKWNRGELAEGWYDPSITLRAGAQTSPRSRAIANADQLGSDKGEQSEDDDLGPALPVTSVHSHGPAIPNLQDLQYRRELEQEDHAGRGSQLQQDRKLERKADKERMEELVPRADPGSRQRQLEKKREVAVSNKDFAAARESGALDIPESDLLGEDGLDVYKAKKRDQERQKNEREIRREETLRAREAAREERLIEHRRKEEKTMEVLRALARQRYGSA